MIDKYPYFLDKRPNSNFYKVTSVYNENFKLMYSDLFKVYESFHLNKKLLVWKEQFENYNYALNFVANYPLLKSVKIYKNDILIYMEEYDIKEEKNHFDAYYNCDYLKNNIPEINAYKCSECGEIYFDDNIPVKCTNCNNKKYYQTKIYRCSECGEIYFSNETITDCTINNHTNTLEQVKAYRCLSCDGIYFTTEPPSECPDCYYEDYLNQSPIRIKGTWNEDIPDDFKEEFTVGVYDKSTLVDTVLLNRGNSWQTDTKNLPLKNSDGEDITYTISYTVDNCNVEIIEYEKHHTPRIEKINPPLYTDDKALEITDYINGEVVEPILVDDETLEGGADITFKVMNNNTPLTSAIITLTNNNYKGYAIVTDNDGNANLTVENGVYNLSVACSGYITYNTVINVNSQDIDLSINLEQDKSASNPEEILNSTENLSLQVPVIASDKFIIDVETYDEYNMVKGFPENDEPLGDCFDHDYSLDEIGVLNNIPRKNYIDVADELQYPFTEPPYNNKTTEDDYHYMKRMIEYNQRLWTMNPVSLELWKMYGVDSTVINRERYLLKVFDETKHPFDENTGLVKCWSPEAWEHKDKFCDGSATLGEYFFVTASTVRPIPHEKVDFYFKILNSLADEIDEEYTVNIYKIIYDETTNTAIEKIIAEGIEDDSVRMHYHSIDEDKPNVFRFKGIRKDGTEIGTTEIIINVRTWRDADLFVNSEYTGDYCDGSFKYPFKTLQEALDKVTSNNDLICLLSSTHIDKPLMVSQSSIILGYTPDGDEDATYLSVIQDGVEEIEVNQEINRKDFFNIVGNKNCKLTLAELKLTNNIISSNIRINRWLNSNTNTDSYETVIIHGGTVNITFNLNQDTFYPYDFIDVNCKLTGNDDNILPNNTLNVFYNNKLIDSYITDENGEINFKFNLNEWDTDDYYLVIGNESTIFFETTFKKLLHASKTPHYYELDIGESQKLESSIEYHNGDTVKVFSDDDSFNKTIDVTNDGVIVIDDAYSPVFGRYVIYTTIDNEKNSPVSEEWCVECKFYIKDLPKTSGNETILIKNLDLKTNGDMTYDTVTINNNTKLSDLEGVVIDFKQDEDNLTVDVFHVSDERSDDDKLLYSDALVLTKAIYNVEVDEVTGDVHVDRLGQFW